MALGYRLSLSLSLAMHMPGTLFRQTINDCLDWCVGPPHRGNVTVETASRIARQRTPRPRPWGSLSPSPRLGHDAPHRSPNSTCT